MATSIFRRYGQFLIGLTAGALLSAGIWTLAQPVEAPKAAATARLTTPPPAELLPDEQNTIAIFQKTAPAVVFITNKALRTDFFSMNVMEIPQGSGSGFLWDAEGHVVTNYHVIEGANALTVTLNDQSSYEADVVGAEPSKDLAVLRIKAPAGKLRPLPAGSSADLYVGQKVIAIGNPFGLDQSLTVGVVSAVGRQIQSATNRTIHDVIQTDTAINPGNSGGPLLDSGGRLIGVNTAIVSPSGAYAGVGFAVPVNTVKRIVPQLIQYGKVIRPGLGVSLLPDSVAERVGIEGIIIADVLAGGSAKEAGLVGIQRSRFGETTLGDVILAVNDRPVRNTDELANELERYKVGDTVTITILRDEEKKQVPIRLQQIE